MQRKLTIVVIDTTTRWQVGGGNPLYDIYVNCVTTYKFPPAQYDHQHSFPPNSIISIKKQTFTEYQGDHSIMERAEICYRCTLW